jgi:hypothetical protein
MYHSNAPLNASGTTTSLTLSLSFVEAYHSISTASTQSLLTTFTDFVSRSD